MHCRVSQTPLSRRGAREVPGRKGKRAARRQQIVAAIKPSNASSSTAAAAADDDGDDDNNNGAAPCSSRRSLLLASTTTSLAAAATIASSAAAAAAVPRAFSATVTPPPPPLAAMTTTTTTTTAATAAATAATCKPSVSPPLPPSIKHAASLEIERARVAVLRAVSSSSSSEASPTRDRNLDGYEAMAALHARDPRLFHALLASDRATFAPLVYTPAVADACASWGTLLTRPSGLYLSAADSRCAGGVGLRSVVDAWGVAEDGDGAPRLAVISDGHRILALGDLAAHGMGIPVGKCFLHSAGGGLAPSQCLPVIVDAGRGRQQDEEEFDRDPFYLGLRSPRLRGAAYDALLSEAFEALRGRFGKKFIIHLEDFAGADAEALLERDGAQRMTSFSDDIACTGAAAMGAVLAACGGGSPSPSFSSFSSSSAGVEGVPPLAEQVFLFFGAGQAAVGVARCAAAALAAPLSEGGGGLASLAEAKKRIFMVDSRGLVVKKDKQKDGGGGEATSRRRSLKDEFARDADDPVVLSLSQRAAKKKGASGGGGGGGGSAARPSLADIVAAVGPTALVGAAGVAGAFDSEVLKALMTKKKRRSDDKRSPSSSSPPFRPIVLALSNPTSFSECTPSEAAEATGGRAVFASGSPFAEYLYRNQKRPAPSQANNALVFPGVALGLVAADASSGLGSSGGGESDGASSSSTSSSSTSLATLLPAARALAELAAAAARPRELLARDALVLPGVGDLPRATRAVAAAVALAAVEEGRAGSECLPALRSAAAKLSEARRARARAEASGNEQAETAAAERLRQEALREAEEAIAPLQFDGVAAFEASFSSAKKH